VRVTDGTNTYRNKTQSHRYPNNIADQYQPADFRLSHFFRSGREKCDSLGAMRIEAVQGDITRETTDAIVNAANEGLAPGGGVCGAIHAAGGPAVAEACRQAGRCHTGRAVATTAGRLPARWVIHAVGPVWRGGHAGEAELLASAYRAALDEAARVGARSVAFPAISTGIYGYPLEAATAVAVAAVREWKGEGVDLIRFVCFDAATLQCYRATLPDA
jgi:O-acetyl-ADP-ribose deacetylase (regulator of RNase III)